MWAPSTFHSRVSVYPSPGTQKAMAGEMQSSVTATSHNASRHSPAAKPPATHSAAEAAYQTPMRRKLRNSLGPERTAQSMNAVRPSWNTAKASANASPRSPNASGSALDITSPMPISTNSISRTRGFSGSSQLVIHAVSIHAHQMATSSSAA